MHYTDYTDSIYNFPLERNNMKNTDSTTTTAGTDKVLVDGIKIYSEPKFVTYRSVAKKFYCKDKNGKTIAEFEGMHNLTDYVSKKTGKSRNYIRQYVYKHLNKKVEYLGYYWTDK